ncbi:hypothetical protein MMC07_003431 [Pseudocyphellaria aurata]|nr:hypothetical protein [Pseudocyphellaria aurata]
MRSLYLVLGLCGRLTLSVPLGRRQFGDWGGGGGDGGGGGSFAGAFDNFTPGGDFTVASSDVFGSGQTFPNIAMSSPENNIFTSADTSQPFTVALSDTPLPLGDLTFPAADPGALAAVPPTTPDPGVTVPGVTVPPTDPGAVAANPPTTPGTTVPPTDPGAVAANPPTTPGTTVPPTDPNAVGAVPPTTPGTTVPPTDPNAVGAVPPTTPGTTVPPTSGTGTAEGKVPGPVAVVASADLNHIDLPKQQETTGGTGTEGGNAQEQLIETLKKNAASQSSPDSAENKVPGPAAVVASTDPNQIDPSDQKTTEGTGTEGGNAQEQLIKTLKENSASQSSTDSAENKVSGPAAVVASTDPNQIDPSTEGTGTKNSGGGTVPENSVKPADLPGGSGSSSPAASTNGQEQLIAKLQGSQSSTPDQNTPVAEQKENSDSQSSSTPEQTKLIEELKKSSDSQSSSTPEEKNPVAEQNSNPGSQSSSTAFSNPSSGSGEVTYSTKAPPVDLGKNPTTAEVTKQLAAGVAPETVTKNLENTLREHPEQAYQIAGLNTQRQGSPRQGYDPRTAPLSDQIIASVAKLAVDAGGQFVKGWLTPDPSRQQADAQIRLYEKQTEIQQKAQQSTLAANQAIAEARKKQALEDAETALNLKRKQNAAQIALFQAQLDALKAYLNQKKLAPNERNDATQQRQQIVAALEAKKKEASQNQKISPEQYLALQQQAQPGQGTGKQPPGSKQPVASETDPENPSQESEQKVASNNASGKNAKPGTKNPTPESEQEVASNNASGKNAKPGTKNPTPESEQEVASNNASGKNAKPGTKNPTPESEQEVASNNASGRNAKPGTNNPTPESEQEVASNPNTAGTPSTPDANGAQGTSQQTTPTPDGSSPGTPGTPGTPDANGAQGTSQQTTPTPDGSSPGTPQTVATQQNPPTPDDPSTAAVQAQADKLEAQINALKSNENLLGALTPPEYLMAASQGAQQPGSGAQPGTPSTATTPPASTDPQQQQQEELAQQAEAERQRQAQQAQLDQQAQLAQQQLATNQGPNCNAYCLLSNTAISNRPTYESIANSCQSQGCPLGSVQATATYSVNSATPANVRDTLLAQNLQSINGGQIPGSSIVPCSTTMSYSYTKFCYRDPSSGAQVAMFSTA